MWCVSSARKPSNWFCPQMQHTLKTELLMFEADSQEAGNILRETRYLTSFCFL